MKIARWAQINVSFWFFILSHILLYRIFYHERTDYHPIIVSTAWQSNCKLFEITNFSSYPFFCDLFKSEMTFSNFGPNFQTINLSIFRTRNFLWEEFRYIFGKYCRFEFSSWFFGPWIFGRDISVILAWYWCGFFVAFVWYQCDLGVVLVWYWFEKEFWNIFCRRGTRDKFDIRCNTLWYLFRRKIPK